MTPNEVLSFTGKIREELRGFRTRLSDAENPLPDWASYRPEIVNEKIRERKAGVLRALQMDLARLRKTVTEKHQELRKERYSDLYPDTASFSPAKQEAGRYFDWRGNALLGIGIENHIAELRGLIEVGEQGEYATRVYDWLKVRPMTDGERQKHGVDLVGVLADFEATRGFADWAKVEKSFNDVTKDLNEAASFLNLPADLQRRPATFADWERQQEALGR